MADTPVQNSGKVVTYAVYSDGTKVSDLLRFKSIRVNHEINRIGSAVLKLFVDGMPQGDITESSSDDFKPGKKIKIELGYENTNKPVFEGIVVSHRLSFSGQSDSLLVVECKNSAVKATVARKNRVFEKKKDSEAIQVALSEAGLTVTVDTTSVQHPQLMQYYCTDWDFALSRADACGLVAITDGDKVSIKRPEVSAGSVFKVTYGTDLLAFDGELLAEDQFAAVECIGWDAATQKAVVANASKPALNKQGNLSVDDISKAAGAAKITLQTDACSDNALLKAWADATLLKSGLARFSGTFTFRGHAAAVPGCIIELAGLSNRFNGNVYVGSVTHTVEQGVWTTEAGMGISPVDITHQPDVVSPSASGLLPGIEGLHIGVVTKLADDPDAACRIQVQIPLLRTEKDTVWARLASFSASNKTGAFFLPSVGDEVVIGFVNNDPNNAIVLGSMYSKKYAPPYTAAAENYKRAIVTPEKLTVEMDDEKKIITVITPGKNTIILSDDAKGITLKDQNSNVLTMNDSGIKITSNKDITLSAKGNITVDATQKTTVKAKQDVAVEGMNVNVKAQIGAKINGAATAELSASGQTVVKGAMVMIN